MENIQNQKHIEELKLVGFTDVQAITIVKIQIEKIAETLKIVQTALNIK